MTREYEPVPEANWAALSLRLSETLGLHFPPERWTDLERKVAVAMPGLGFDDLGLCVQWLVSSPWSKAQVQILAAELVVGETYFFRDKPLFGLLGNQLLPRLIQARRNGNKRLRFWSAACCTGEEAYSLAILLRQLLPDIAEWNVSIVATDINERFLRKATAATYGDWSFRNTPPGFHERYFQRAEDGRYVVLAQIREMVTFRQLNLVEEIPLVASESNPMDLIICQNVLMYFSMPQIRRVVAKFHEGLADKGWLSVSAGEATATLFPQFKVMSFPDMILFCKEGKGIEDKNAALDKNVFDKSALDKNALEKQRSNDSAAWMSLGDPTTSDRFQSNSTLVVPPQIVSTPIGEPAAPILQRPAPAALTKAQGLYQQGLYADAATVLIEACTGSQIEARFLSLLVRTLTIQGRFGEALRWLDQWIRSDKMDPRSYYLRATVLMEQGELSYARASLQKAIYIDPEFVLAHFLLGNLALGDGNPVEARRHLGTAKRLLARCGAQDLVDESDGLTAGRLSETVTSLMSTEARA